MEPDFVVIGTPKSGTTSLWELLGQHPEVAVCSPKEINFFSHDENYSRGWDWYERAFPGAAGAKAVVDVSPAYGQTFNFPAAPERLARHVPDATLIYIVRDPIEGILSSYRQCLYTGHPMPRAFSRALREYAPLVESRRYWRRLADFRRLYPDRQIKVLLFEDLRSDPGRFMADLCRLLGVDDRHEFADAHRPRNSTLNRGLPTAWTRLLRILPGSLMARIGERQRRVVRGWTTRPPPRVKWDDDALAWVRRELADDVRETLRYAGKPLDYWGAWD